MQLAKDRCSMLQHATGQIKKKQQPLCKTITQSAHQEPPHECLMKRQSSRQGYGCLGREKKPVHK